MNMLKEDFKNWLAKQGLSDSLVNGKPSTVYEYVRQLDILLRKLYQTDDWTLLIENATILIFFYLLCGKSKYHKNNCSFEKIQNYLKYNHTTNISTDILEEFAKYKVEEANLQKILSNKSFNEKAGITFTKFYQFIFEEQKQLRFSLQDMKTAINELLRILIKLRLQPISATSPAKIEAPNQTSSQKVTIDELANFLDCSRKTVMRLIEKEHLALELESINLYLMEHYHPSTLTRLYQPNFLNEKWYTIAEAADFLDCSQSNIKKMIKKGLLSFTNYSARKIKILGFDLKFFKK